MNRRDFLSVSAVPFLAGCVGAGSDAIAQPMLLTQEVKAQLESAADNVYSRIRPPGMIALISVEGESDYFIKRGVSNRETGMPMNEDYYFRIASNTKTFTGAAVLILADEGKINLDTPIATYLPEYNIPNAERITVRMLGNMTSGLFDYLGNTAFMDQLAASGNSLAYTPQQILAAALRHPSNFQPGTQYEYCNTNIVLLGLLMEKVTGKSARQVIDERVIQPLGLAHTYWPATGTLAMPFTHGYSGSGELLDASNWNPSVSYTAGILVSTFADMKIWARAVADGRLLSEKSRAERFKWIGDHYGFCVMKVGYWIGHPGTIYGYNSHVFFHTEKKIALVILVNKAIPEMPVEDFSTAFRSVLDM